MKLLLDALRTNHARAVVYEIDWSRVAIPKGLVRSDLRPRASCTECEAELKRARFIIADLREALRTARNVTEQE